MLRIGRWWLNWPLNLHETDSNRYLAVTKKLKLRK